VSRENASLGWLIVATVLFWLIVALVVWEVLK
jgi:hypothetical protein